MKTSKGYRLIHVPIGLGLCTHCFYIKEHQQNSSKDHGNSKALSSISGSSKGKVLFVGNIDYPIINPSSKTCMLSQVELDSFLRDLFQSFGDIESITVSQFNTEDIIDLEHQNQNPFTKTRFAHVHFKSSSSCKASLTTSESLYMDIGDSIARKWGLASALTVKTGSAEISRSLLSLTPYFDVHPRELKDEVEMYMKDFEEGEHMKMLQDMKRMTEADEDGFVVVKTKSKRGREEEGDITGTGRGGGEGRRSRVKRKGRDLQNFYRHQMREERREVLHSLRKRFEDDKARVAEMKASRKFKPF